MKILRMFDSLKFVVAAIVCTFILNVAHAATLPAGYTELEYLQSTGTQWIDTGYILQSNDVTYEWTAEDLSTSNNTSLFGSEQTENPKYSGILYGNKTSRKLYVGNSSYVVTYSSDSGFHDWVLSLTNDHNATLYKDGTLVSNVSFSGDLQKSTSIGVFNNHKSAYASNQYAQMMLKKFVIKDNNAVAVNLIPARRDSDGVLGMYDLADANPATAFHTNAGTGDFVAGPAVSIKIATTRYNEQQFTQVETDLDAARTVINDLITQMQTNAVNVSKLAVEKQTRPNATCPVGKNCLLVTDPTGAENWYEIAGADAVQSSSTTPDYFSFTTTALNAGDSVSFDLTPTGTFTVDWGDGSVPQVIERTNTTSETYSHSYSNAGPKTVKITGRATGYSTEQYTGVLSFGSVSQIASIDGCLGAIFPTLGNASGQQPQFYNTFFMSQITSIPAGLFSGITGAADYMFYGTFSDSKITSIPAGLFSGVTGAAVNMFSGTFASTQITSIPENLFSGVTGAALFMFNSTFYNTQIKSIPENLFRGVTGAESMMFAHTFANTQITSIPENLFSGVTGAAGSMFFSTFAETQITSIPAGLFRGVTGAADTMFYRTFAICENLSGYIPESTFAGLIQNNSPDAGGFMTDIFQNSSGLATTCPQNTTEVSTPYKSKYWDPDYNGNYAVMCRPN